MRPIFKVFFFGAIVFSFSLLPAAGSQSGRLSAPTPTPESNHEEPKVVERDSIREMWYKQNLYPYADPFEFNTDQFPRSGEAPAHNTGVFPLTPAEQRAMKAIIEDFLVNDDTSGGCGQWVPSIARHPSGNFIITWHDYRNGNPDIYAQRFDSSGNPIDSSFKVNDDIALAEQYNQAIAMDDSGNFVITWEDYRDGNANIYAQRFSSSDSLLGVNFKVNTSSGTARQILPDIAIDPAGYFVITWQDSLNGHWDIYAQMYDPSGYPQGPNFRVNSDAGTSIQGAPAIAKDDSGYFVITWYDNRYSGYYGIYARRYDRFGNPVCSDFQVSTYRGSVGWPDIAMHNSGSYVITWHDRRDYNWNIYARMYYASCTPKATDFKVNDDPGTADQRYPAIAIDFSGNFAISWSDYRNGNWDIYARRYHSSGIPQGSSFKVNDDLGSADQGSSDVAMDSSGNFVITWHDWRNGGWPNSDIYTQMYDAGGNKQGINFKANDDVTSSYQVSPAIATDSSGNFVIVFEDQRSGNSDIYAQRYDSSGNPLDPNFKVNKDPGTAWQWSPDIAMCRSGRFVITWTDNRSDTCDIYAQIYDSTGAPWGPNFKVNDVATSGQEGPAIAMDCFCNFVIAWHDKRNGNWDIYAQRYDSYGTPIGSNFKVNDNTGTSDQRWPDVSMCCSGNFVVTWHDYRSGNWDIYAQRYDSSGAKLLDNFRVNFDDGTAWQLQPAIAMDDSCNFAITWHDYRNGNWDIYAQRYKSNGASVDTNFKVNDGAYDQVYPAIAMDGSGNFVITWEDWRNGYYNMAPSDVYVQRYDPSGNRSLNNYLVPNPRYASFYQGVPAVAVSKSKIYFTWQDNRRAKGGDIYSKIVNFFYFLRGDANGDNKVNIADIVYLVSYLFKFGPEPKPELGIGDANCDGKVTVADVVYLVSYLFKQGPPPCL